MGRYIREQCAREGVECRGHSHRPGPADLAGAPRHPRRKNLSAHLLSGQLRRQRARRRRHRPGLHRERRRRFWSPAPISPAPTPPPRSSRRCASPERPGAGSCSTSTSAPISGDLAGHRRGGGALHQVGRGDADPQRQVLPQCDLIVGTEEEHDDRPAGRRSARGSGIFVRAAARSTSGAQARADGLRRLPRRDSRDAG